MSSFRARIFLLIVAMGFGFGLVASIFLWWQLNQIFDRESHARIRAVAQALSHISIGHMVADDRLGGRDSLLEMKAQHADIEYIYLVDFNGRVFAHTFTDGFPAALIDLKLPDEVREGQDILHLDSDRGVIHHSSHPVIRDSRAHLHVGTRASAVHAPFNRTLEYVVLITVGIAFVGCLIGVSVSRRITAPLDGLAKLLTAYGRGEALDDRSVLALGTGGQELVALRRAFKEMIDTRESAERLRQESEAALAEAQRLAQVGNWRWSIERNELISGSEECARIHGVGPDQIHDLMKRQMEQVIHPEDRDRFAAVSKQVDEEGLDYEIEYRIVRPDGEVRHVLEIGKAVFDAAGRPVEHVGTLQDVTEREQSERQLRKTLSQLRHAQRIANLEYWVWDAREDRIDLPEGNPMMVGLSRDEVVGLSDDEFIERFVHPDDRRRVREAFGPPSEKKAAIDVEYRIVRPDGEVRFVHDVGEPVFDEDGDLVGQVGTLQDITERKRSEQALEKSLTHLQHAQRIAKLDNWVWDAKTNTITTPSGAPRVISDKLEDFVGLSDEEFVERFVHPDDRARVLEAYGPVSAKNTTVNVEYRAIRPDGEVIYVHEVGEPVFDEDGEMTGQFGTLQDITDRKRVEQALQKSEASLANAQRIAHLGNWDWDAKNDDLFWSAETYRIFGLEPKPLKTPVTRFLDMVHADDRERILKAWRRALEDRTAYEVVHRIVRADGAVRFVHQLSEATYDGGGKPISVSGTIQDITERKRAEEALRESEKRFRDFTETASDWFWEMDENLRFTYLSDRFEQGTGVPMEEVIGLTRKELYDHHMAASERDNHEKWRAHYDLVEDRQPFRSLEVTWSYPNGTERSFLTSGKPVFDEAGAFRGYRGTGVEVTDRKKAEAALRDSEERFRSLFEQGAVGMACMSPEGHFVQVNEAYREFTGFSESELMDNRLDLVVHSDDLQKAIEHRQSVLDGRPVDPVQERRYRHKSGEERWGLAGVAPLRGPDGALEGYIVQVQDITESKRGEEEIRRLNEDLEQRVEARTAELRAAQEELVRRERLAALGQLTGTVSHELRNPLGAMRTSIAAIKKLARDDEPMLKRSVEIVDRSIVRCDNIIGDLLDYSRIRNLAPEMTGLDDWLEGLLAEYKLASGVTLRRRFEAGITLPFDRDRVWRVMINLLDNACQAMIGDGQALAEEGARVLTVATRLAGPHVEISVADTGPGIPTEEIGRIFEPLYSTKAFGVGLGLPIVRQVVEQHGGAIEVDQAAADGTRMVVRLPLPEPAQKAAS